MSALVAESWTWYAATWVVVAGRMVSRTFLVGSFKKLQVDDFLMLFAMLTDTVLMVGMNILAKTPSNLIPPDTDLNFTTDEVNLRIFGSKIVLLVEQMQLITIWAMKICLLIMYNRLTMSLRQNRAVIFVAIYTVVGFIVMEILYMAVWCRPFTEYWAVPTDNIQCSAATNHLITNAIVNISSDIMIILIPMPIFLSSQLPAKRKAILCGVFALGAFTILSAVLNKYYSFTDPFGSDWTFWYIRESSTAIITANLPFLWTLVRRVLNVSSFAGGSSRKLTTQPLSSHFRSAYGQGTRRGDGTQIDRSDSQEEINKTYEVPLKIFQRTEVQISSQDLDVENQDHRVQMGTLPNGLTTTIVGNSVSPQHGLPMLLPDSGRDIDTNSTDSTAGQPVRTRSGV